MDTKKLAVFRILDKKINNNNFRIFYRLYIRKSKPNYICDKKYVPDLVLNNIISYLGIIDILNLKRTCKRMRAKVMIKELPFYNQNSALYFPEIEILDFRTPPTLIVPLPKSGNLYLENDKQFEQFDFQGEIKKLAVLEWDEFGDQEFFQDMEELYIKGSIVDKSFSFSKKNTIKVFYCDFVFKFNFDLPHLKLLNCFGVKAKEKKIETFIRTIFVDLKKCEIQDLMLEKDIEKAFTEGSFEFNTIKNLYIHNDARYIFDTSNKIENMYFFNCSNKYIETMTEIHKGTIFHYLNELPTFNNIFNFSIFN